MPPPADPPPGTPTRDVMTDGEHAAAGHPDGYYQHSLTCENCSGYLRLYFRKGVPVPAAVTCSVCGCPTGKVPADGPTSGVVVATGGVVVTMGILTLLVAILCGFGVVSVLNRIFLGTP